MPLYLEDLDGLAMPHAFMQALLQMADSVGDRPVNPAIAANLLRGYLAPLIDPPNRSLIERQDGQQSWQRLHLLYLELAAASRGHDRQLLAAAMVVHILVRFSTRPPRDLFMPGTLEVSSFTRMAGYLGLTVQQPLIRLGDQVVNLYGFCRYCWLPAVQKGVCTHHSSRRVEQSGKEGPLCAQLTPKQAQRLEPIFTRVLHATVSRQELQFHESGFDAPALVPPSGLATWLSLQRPALSQALTEWAAPATGRTLEQLLRFLYGNDAASVLQVIGASVHLLTPVTIRAESLLTAVALRPSWGGSRRNAGRRRTAVANRQQGVAE